MNFKKLVANTLHQTISSNYLEDDFYNVLEIPKHTSFGDVAFPCFILSKTLKQPPQKIAEDLASTLKSQYFQDVKAVGPYVNFFLNNEYFSGEILKTVVDQKHNYGALKIGNGENITIDLSSPNIAKPFSMGHLRSTVIGNSIANIVEKCGYKPVKINHLGDWGTQFGKLIVAYKKWGDQQKVEAEPIKELLELYVKFHEEAEKHNELENEARYYFKKLEDGDEESLALWKWFREESLKEFQQIYDLLNISFDSFNGEAFYNDKMEEVVELLENKGLLLEDNGAQVVRLDEEEMPPCLIRKSDGATLYATRDLSAAIYRKRTYHFAKSIYVVGNEQNLHFKQLFAVLKKLGYDYADDMIHVPFGLILKDGKKMSTRKGRVVLLEEVLREAITMANQNIQDKNPLLQNKEEIAKQVGVGAVIFHDLKNERMNNVEFSLEEMLRFEGETGPYVQYTFARACSILKKGNYLEVNQKVSLCDDLSWEIVKQLNDFPFIIEKAYHRLEPSAIAKYVIDLAQVFNKYYGSVKILHEDTEKQSRLALVQAVKIVLHEGLRLLGIAAPEEM